jgi:lipopolysaccharide/colanic/teichoic acid biosynthesis glycosyltransferase/glycosyltransferase involved in cell wall biosynthesis
MGSTTQMAREPFGDAAPNRPSAPGPRPDSASAGPHPAPRVLYVLTAPFGLDRTLGGQLRYLRSAGFEPIFACSPGAALPRFAAAEGVCGHAVAIEREISPLSDLRSLWKLWRLARRLRPAISNVSAPKGGLLGGLAAWLAGVPCRLYTLRGLRLETAGGVKFAVLWAAEWLACRLAQRVVCVSPSLARRALKLRLAAPEKVIVIADGSSNGIDPRLYAPGPALARRVRRLRRGLALAPGAPVLGFVGRLTRDKGIAELVAAYHRLRRRWPPLRLLLVGCFEAGDPVPAGVRAAVDADPGILVTGFVDDPAPYYQLMDVVALPTYREGYPTVALEAAAAGRPFVTTRVTGASDAVVDGQTGLLVPARDAAALAEALASLLADPERAASLARRARQRIVADFSRQRIWKALEQLYRDLLAREPGGELRREPAGARNGQPRGERSGQPRAERNGQPRGERNGQSGRAVWPVWNGRSAAAPCPTVAGPRNLAASVPGVWALSGAKRAFDLGSAALGLALLSPLLLLVAAAVAFSMGRPILFRQQRSGLNGRLFRICKFRTLAGGDSRAAATDAARLTPLGRLLRQSSLDELPQLWNVLRGEMSLVGPRPLPRRYEPRYTARQRRRLDVRPGITGWAQVCGRNSLGWRQRFELDVAYVDSARPWLDLQILLRSVPLILSRSGVAPPGAALMPEFLGESDSI